MEGREIERLIRLPEVLNIVGMGKSAWYNGIRKGYHPKPIPRGRRDVVWKLSDVQKVVSDTIARFESV